MITWMDILHIYQPPTQAEDVVKKVARESYSLILDLADRYKEAAFTINISGSLVELLERYGEAKLLEDFKKFAESGRIEFMGSAMYHPILPLLPVKEIRRQIELNAAISSRVFGPVYKPAGFFLPEMAYSRKVADVIAKMGFAWIALDEIHFPNGKPDPAVKYILKGTNLAVIFRDRNVSKSFPPEHILEHFKELDGRKLITAHDGELYGHWHKDDKGYYKNIFTSPDIDTVTVSNYLSGLTKTEEVEPRAANWESSEEELKVGDPYSLWNNRNNDIHGKLEQLKQLAVSAVDAGINDPHYAEARNALDRGVASCAWWWASGRKLGALSPVSWYPDEIEKGAKLLISAVRSLASVDENLKLDAEDLYSSLIVIIWSTEWKRKKPKQAK